MVEINPSIKSRVDVLLMSKPIFVPIIGAAKKNRNSKDIRMELMQKFMNTATRAGESVRSKQIRTLIKFENVFLIKPTDIEELFKFYADYKDLKKLYK